MQRVGLGWDRHPLVPGRRCVLGGMEFADCPVGPDGHSDADAVCHALTDAVLGAAGLGDIGTHFPDTDPRWKDADSVRLLTEAVALAARDSWQVVNADCTVITELPMLADAIGGMRKILGEALAVDPKWVSVKATRGEGLGPEGRGECVTVHAVVLVRSVD